LAKGTALRFATGDKPTIEIVLGGKRFFSEFKVVLKEKVTKLPFRRLAPDGKCLLDPGPICCYLANASPAPESRSDGQKWKSETGDFFTIGNGRQAIFYVYVLAAIKKKALRRAVTWNREQSPRRRNCNATYWRRYFPLAGAARFCDLK